MNRELARKVADSVLYEGYMLYPYRPSAIKNRQRWSFGILYPPRYAEVIGGTGRSQMHSECLLEGNTDSTVRIELRLLHLCTKQVLRKMKDGFEPESSISIDGREIESWDDATERSAIFELPIRAGSQIFEFNFAESNKEQCLHDSSGEEVGKAVFAQQQLRGTLFAAVREIREGIWKLSVDVDNRTPLAGNASDRNSALACSLLSAQLILTITSGNFISLLDPQEDLKEAAAGCRNVGSFPVLLGAPGEHEMALCSPILLYDYPQVAPESAGNFFDGTEMDEMLTLRVMTLTDQEKSQLRAAQPKVRELLERTEAGAPEQLMRTHGTIRELRQIAEELTGKQQ